MIMQYNVFREETPRIPGRNPTTPERQCADAQPVATTVAIHSAVSAAAAAVRVAER